MDYQYQNEEQLVHDLHEGNSMAFKYVFGLYYTDLCRYVKNFTSNPDEAEDIVQNSFVSLWRKRKKIIFNTSLKSYLYKSCYNGYIDFYRKKKLINEHLENLRHLEVQSLQSGFEANSKDLEQKKIRLGRAIQDLPEKCREIFILNKYEGLRYQEIANELGISIKTVENQIGIALKRLKQKLKK